MKKILSLLIFTVSCNPGLVPPLSPPNPPSVVKTPASTSQCPAGGYNLTIVADGKTQNLLLCNGDTGSAGTSTVGATGASGQTVVGPAGAVGSQGAAGSAGADGSSGLNIVSKTESANEDQCPNGGTVLLLALDTDQTGVWAADDSDQQCIPICNGRNGAVGETGSQGPVGPSGSNGESVVFTTCPANENQCPTGGNVIVLASDSDGTGIYEVDDDNQQYAVVCNGAVGDTGATGSQGNVGNTGATGATGAAGQSGITDFTIVNMIEPCGAGSSAWKENLLCLADGSLLADFSQDLQGNLTRLAFIPPGSYEDTDNSLCSFKVTSDGSGGLTVSWTAQNGNLAGSVDCANISGIPPTINGSTSGGSHD